MKLRPYGPRDFPPPFRALGLAFGESIFNKEKMNCEKFAGISVTWTNMGLQLHSHDVLCRWRMDCG